MSITASTSNGIATICVIPLTSGAAYITITFYDQNGRAFSGLSVRLTPAQPCIEVVIPTGTDHGLAVDQHGVMQDALIQP